jgi:transposase
VTKSECAKTVVGESPMIDFELWTEVHARFRQGHGKRKIARELGLDRKTVKRILAQERPAPYRRTVSRPTVVTPSLDDIRQRATAVDYHADRIFQELQARGYHGGYEMVKLAVRPLRAERDRLAEATLRFGTAPSRLTTARKDRPVGWGWLSWRSSLSSRGLSRRMATTRKPPNCWDSATPN